MWRRRERFFEPASTAVLQALTPSSHAGKMRRRKKDKTQQEKVSPSSTDHDSMDSSGKAGSSTKSSKQDADASASGVTVTVSPPQHRKKTLFGSLGSMVSLQRPQATAVESVLSVSLVCALFLCS